MKKKWCPECVTVALVSVLILLGGFLAGCPGAQVGAT